MWGEGFLEIFSLPNPKPYILLGWGLGLRVGELHRIIMFRLSKGFSYRMKLGSNPECPTGIPEKPPALNSSPLIKPERILNHEFPEAPPEVRDLAFLVALGKNSPNPHQCPAKASSTLRH